MKGLLLEMWTGLKGQPRDAEASRIQCLRGCWHGVPSQREGATSRHLLLEQGAAGKQMPPPLPPAFQSPVQASYGLNPTKESEQQGPRVGTAFRSTRQDREGQ